MWRGKRIGDQKEASQYPILLTLRYYLKSVPQHHLVSPFEGRLPPVTKYRNESIASVVTQHDHSPRQNVE
jgi:hypothetical protein